MEKLIRRQLLRNLIIIFSLLFVISSFFLFNTRRKIEESGLSAVITQTINQYEQSKKNIEETTQHFQQDYLNRVHAIEYNLQKAQKEEVSDKTLQRLKYLMQIESISLVNHKGEIVYSTEDKIGLNLKDYKGMKKFYNLIDGNNDEDVIEMNGKSLFDGSEQILIGVKSSIKGISMIQVGVTEETYESFVKPYAIQTVVKNLPTVKEKAVFVVNRETGEIEGITKNNDQELYFKENQTSKELVEKLENFNSVFSVKVNGSLRLLQTRVVDGYIFGAYIDSHLVYNGALHEVIMLFLFIVFVLILIYYLIRRVIRRFVLEDLTEIDKNIDKLLHGDYEVKFRSKYDTEFKNLNIILERWKQNYQHREERMTKIIDNINEDIAIFEYLKNINSVFFSKNTVELLNLNKKMLKELKSNPNKFEKYIDDLIEQADEDDIVKSGEKYISLKVFKEEDEVYGVILDKTKEVLEVQEIKTQLERIGEKVYRDSMSGVYNREGLELLVRKALLERMQGILMIFDIDNFKAINDNEGHPKGDEVIIKFAQCLQMNFKENDIVARMGGDEFAVFIKDELFINIMKNKCEVVLEYLRGELREYYEKYHVSASIGVAYVSKGNHTYESLYNSADAALYIAKKTGKNTYYIN